MSKITTKATLLAAVLALGCCKHEGATDTAMAGRPRVSSKEIVELLAGVPGNAAALGFIDLERSPWSLATGEGMVGLDEATRKPLENELREYLERHVGLDVTRLQYAVGFVSGPPLRAAVLLKAVKGALKLPGSASYEGGNVWVVDRANHLSVAIRGEVVVFGETAAVRDALDTLAGKRRAVTEDGKPLVDWLRKETVGAAVAFAAIRPKDLPLPPQLSGIERAAVTIGASGITAAIEGDEPTISSLQSIADKALGQMVTEAEKLHEAARAGTIPPAEGAIAIVSAAYARTYAAKLKPQRNGNRLSTSIDLKLFTSGAPLVVAVVGILAGVAVPAFMDYTKRSKQTEAALQLNKIGKNAKRAYAETGRYPAGTVSLTPPGSCCGQANNHCPAVPELYANNAVWSSLDFQIDEPSLFQYSYRGTADGQGFVAKAVGDLDCDGTSITYVLEGSVSSGKPSVTLTEPPLNAD
jgi:type II secretory pathway pseudopilin PulG